jgi:hypothetical protein
VKTFELSLPDELHARIRQIARREAKPAQEIVRTAISAGLAVRERRERTRAIGAYARRMAGSPHDLDRDLESAAVENLRSSVVDQE